MALRWLWGGYPLAINTLRGGFDVALGDFAPVLLLECVGFASAFGGLLHMKAPASLSHPNPSRHLKIRWDERVCSAGSSQNTVLAKFALPTRVVPYSKTLAATSPLWGSSLCASWSGVRAVKTTG